jgi:hypothetical protein
MERLNTGCVISQRGSEAEERGLLVFALGHGIVAAGAYVSKNGEFGEAFKSVERPAGICGGKEQMEEKVVYRKL